MAKALIYLAVIGAVVGVVSWIEAGAKARLEAGRLAAAVQAQNRSLADVRERSEAAGREHSAELTEAQARITELLSEAAAVADAQPTNQYCEPGCEPRWNSRP